MFKQRVFVDTNVLVYSADAYDERKQAIARKVMDDLEKKSSVVVSTQVMQEFYYTATNKLGIRTDKAEAIIRGFERYTLCVIKPQLVYDAIRISEINRLFFWDGLIIAAAVQTNCSEVYTEDLNAGQRISGVRIVNPFLC